MNEQKNLVFFILIFLAVIAGWHFFYDAPKSEKLAQDTKATSQKLPSSAQTKKAPQLGRTEAISQSARVTINTLSLRGSINLIGARIDDLTLEKYRQTTKPFSDNIELFSPEGSPNPYFAEFGFTTTDKDVVLPDDKTVWSSDREELTQTSGPVSLTWDNGHGLKFVRKISVDNNYLFTVEQSITNTSSKAVNVYPFSQVRRIGTPPVQGYYILHEGPLGYIDNKLLEYDYTDLQEKSEVRHSGTGGWIGITDKYWLAALIPDQNSKFEYFFQDNRNGPENDYLTGHYSEQITIAPGQQVSTKTNLFAGAKVLHLLDGYEAQLNVKHFDLAVDFGWFYFITKPLFYLLDYLNHWIGNFGLAILLLTVLIKLVFYPLANKSYRSMARMKSLQPKMERLKEQYADDKMRMNQELMALYKKEKINPAAGCLPIVIQIPVFFALYKVLFVTIEMRHAPFYGWIRDLSAPDPTTIFNLVGLIPWDPPSFLMIGVLPVLMGASMWVQQKLNPAPADPVQQKMFMIMPVMLTVLLAQFPAGLVLYWTWNNILSIAQQWMIMKTAGRSAKKSAQ